MRMQLLGAMGLALFLGSCNNNSSGNKSNIKSDRYDGRLDCTYSTESNLIDSRLETYDEDGFSITVNNDGMIVENGVDLYEGRVFSNCHPSHPCTHTIDSVVVTNSPNFSRICVESTIKEFVQRGTTDITGSDLDIENLDSIQNYSYCIEQSAGSRELVYTEVNGYSAEFRIEGSGEPASMFVTGECSGTLYP